MGKSSYAVIGPEGATNSDMIKGQDGFCALIDADIRRSDEVEAALSAIACAKMGHLSIENGGPWAKRLSETDNSDLSLLDQIRQSGFVAELHGNHGVRPQALLRVYFQPAGS